MMKSLRAIGVVYLFLALSLCLMPAMSHGQVSADTQKLELVVPADVYVIAKMNDDRRTFANHIFWEDIPKEFGTLIHGADTTGWRAKNSPNIQDSLSLPVPGGVYTGAIDRTIRFTVLNSGRVGVSGLGRPDIIIRFSVVGLEFWTNTLDVGAVYTPGEPLDCIFNNTNDSKIDD